MPGMDGIEAMQQGTDSNPDLTHVPIMALRYLAMTRDRYRCLASGATDFIRKPVKLSQLVNTIKQMVISQ